MMDQGKLVCGLVMPISAIDGCSEAHWLDVKAIHCDAINQAGFEPNLVSNADDSGVIQKRIVQNLYDNPMVVVDMSGRNPNVMFELGMRLAFDKPAIVVRDDKTPYAFDTSPIEHVGYPRDLRFQLIVDFKAKLAAKIIATHKSAIEDPNYTTFLKHFGEFVVAKLDKKEVSAEQARYEELKDEIKALRNVMRVSANPMIIEAEPLEYRLQLDDNVDQETIYHVITKVIGNDSLVDAAIVPFSNKRFLHLKFLSTESNIETLLDVIRAKTNQTGEFRRYNPQRPWR